MRCQVTDASGVKLIDDSYNASPSAMRAAFDLLREVDAPGERVVVLRRHERTRPDQPAMASPLGRRSGHTVRRRSC